MSRALVPAGGCRHRPIARRNHGITPENVKLRLPPRQSRGFSFSQIERDQDSFTHGSATAIRARFRASGVPGTAIQAPAQTDTARPVRRILDQLPLSGTPATRLRKISLPRRTIQLMRTANNRAPSRSWDGTKRPPNHPSSWRRKQGEYGLLFARIQPENPRTPTPLPCESLSFHPSNRVTLP